MDWVRFLQLLPLHNHEHMTLLAESYGALWHLCQMPQDTYNEALDDVV